MSALLTFQDRNVSESQLLRNKMSETDLNCATIENRISEGNNKWLGHMMTATAKSGWTAS